ncbi:flagellar hook-associated protein FlgK [Paeniglutamicibacter cryotolerans]|uniref:Flagellar hook-associated protein 1 n=1 Tax=Paeniglutamicibacter cryotolerans TaxID=670079 RepID=A0A839QCQ4_9MICC|nr:flagellar hook-associated protein FlgK [Paeniglutamicibacter cryotolerans]MBB2993908.1 flagellar hook-associated protein 1 FlgK [Paeniglutamicibacter cryotolerans]
MSTFSGLNTAMTGLAAARMAMETAGNNMTNVKTAGYTRQRAEFDSIGSVATIGRLAGRSGPGQGVAFGGIARLADAHLDARVRGTLAIASYSDTKAEGLSNLEGVLREPGENGLSALLNDFWAGWQDVANQPGESSPAAVLLERAKSIADRFALTHSEVSGQWSSQRATLDTMASELNSAAAAVAELNGQIRSATATGGSPNALLDQRSQLTERMAEISGATVRDNADGSVDVLLDGNALVSGTTIRPVQVSGSATIDGTVAPSLQWAHRIGEPIALESGRMAAALSLLAPATAQGTGGKLAEMVKSLDSIARELATRVNLVQSEGRTVSGTVGPPFFAFDLDNPATSLRVVATGASDLATGTPGGGALDGSNALRMSGLGSAKDGPDALWNATVITVGVASKSAAQQALASAVAASTAAGAQMSLSAVSLDEENVSLLASQHAFQGAARVMTAVDEMLDTLINRTGIVGR